jgi:hypothetical protein
MILTEENIYELFDRAIIILKAEGTALNHFQGAAFEKVLYDALMTSSKQLEVSNLKKIDHVSGKKYPDIVIILSDQTKLGVEVKTSKTEGWSTLGGSIFESTRVKGVEQIFLFFAQFSDPNHIRFRYQTIEECIADVVITHKPRYKIDMDLKKTFFSQSNVSYKEIRSSNQPFSLIRPYLKKRAGEHADLWWISDNDDSNLENFGPQSIRFYSSLNNTEKISLMTDIYILFPRILSNSRLKYKVPSLYLVTKKGIIHPSIRDAFTAGGQMTFKNRPIPKYFKFLINNIEQVLQHFNHIPTLLFEEYWTDYNPDLNLIDQWYAKIVVEIKGNPHCAESKNIIIDHIDKYIEIDSSKSTSSQLSLF